MNAWTRWNAEHQNHEPAVVSATAQKWAAFNAPFSLQDGGASGYKIVVNRNGVRCFEWQKFGWPIEQAEAIVRRSNEAAVLWWMTQP